MEHFDTIIKNGNVVLPTGVRKLDIGVTNGKFSAVEKDLQNKADRVIHADNHYIFPGAIDIHVHFNEPGHEDWEGFHTGSAMLGAGGCTTYFDMPLNGIPSTVTVDALKQKAEIAENKSLIDFGLWGGLVPGNLEEIHHLAQKGVIGFKAFLSPSGNEAFEHVDDAILLKGMKRIAETGKILALHSESTAIIKFLEGEITGDDAASFAATRPIEAEAEAVQRALSFAKITNCPLHFVHISSAQSVQIITKAKQQGMDVTLETCPHYLLCTMSDLETKGAAAKCAPPLRDERENRRLIESLLEDKIDMITSDHSPCPPELKDPANFSLRKAWGGINGGQFTLLSMIELAIKHDIPFERIAKWTASNPAKRFHLADKGEIRVGMDADLAIISLDQAHTVTAENLFSRHKQSLYMDHTFPCRIIGTINRGTPIYQADKDTKNTGKGKWLRG